MRKQVAGSFASAVTNHKAAVIAATGRADHPRVFYNYYPRDFFSTDPQVKRPDGTLIANSWRSFWDSYVDVEAGVVTLSGADTFYWVGNDDGRGSCGSTTAWYSIIGPGGSGYTSSGIERLSATAPYGGSGHSGCTTPIPLLCVSY